MRNKGAETPTMRKEKNKGSTHIITLNGGCSSVDRDEDMLKMSIKNRNYCNELSTKTLIVSVDKLYRLVLK